MRGGRNIRCESQIESQWAYGPERGDRTGVPGRQKTQTFRAGEVMFVVGNQLVNLVTGLSRLLSYSRGWMQSSKYIARHFDCAGVELPNC